MQLIPPLNYYSLQQPFNMRHCSDFLHISALIIVLCFVQSYWSLEIDARFFKPHYKKRSSGILLFSKAVSSDSKCAVFCQEQITCFSFNVIRSENGTLICQIHSATVQQNIINDETSTLYGEKSLGLIQKILMFDLDLGNILSLVPKTISRFPKEPLKTGSKSCE